jgi:hypothetical protein
VKELQGTAMRTVTSYKREIVAESHKWRKVLDWATQAHKIHPLQRTYFMTDVAEDTTHLQNTVLSFCLQWSQN